MSRLGGVVIFLLMTARWLLSSHLPIVCRQACDDCRRPGGRLGGAVEIISSSATNGRGGPVAAPAWRRLAGCCGHSNRFIISASNENALYLFQQSWGPALGGARMSHSQSGSDLGVQALKSATMPSVRGLMVPHGHDGRVLACWPCRRSGKRTLIMVASHTDDGFLVWAEQ